MNQLTISEAYAQAEEYHREALASAERSLKERKERIDATFQGAAWLSGAGFTVPPIHKYNWNDLQVAVEKTELKRVHDALGRLKLSGKHIDDCKKRIIRVDLTPVAYPSITISYTTKLPRKAKCKIVTQRQRAYTYKTLLCDV
jgi:hypothetical protein